MRELSAQTITEVVARLCVEANYHLPADIRQRLEMMEQAETWPVACDLLQQIRSNYQLAEKMDTPICQDTGLACVFLKIGQDVHITGNLTDAVNAGVAKGYTEGFLRKSAVADPLRVDELRQCATVFLMKESGQVAAVDLELIGDGFQPKIGCGIKLNQCDGLPDIV